MSVYFIFLAAVLLLVAGCAERQPSVHTREVFALNTFLTFRVYGGIKAEQALEQAIKRIHDIENKMSITIADSDVSRINKNAGIIPVRVHKDTLYVVKRALEYSRITKGAFDITIYPIARLWGIGTEDARVPAEYEIAAKLPLVDYRRVAVNEESMTVFLEKEGMGIDLGGIGKGYAADEVVKILRQAGVEHAIINMGGSITTIGSRPDGRSWRIGVRNPRREDGQPEHIAVVEVHDLSVLSAGDYERFMVDVYKETGIRHHHIFDPDTGYPSDSGVMAATVVAASAIEADALSTSVLVMGAKEGIKMIEQIEGTQGMAITADKKIHHSSAFAGRIELTDPLYTIVP